MICIPTTCWVVIDTENYAMCEHGCCRSRLTQSPDEDSIIIPILQMRKTKSQTDYITHLRSYNFLGTRQKLDCLRYNEKLEC